jgi:hypothetical protein
MARISIVPITKVMLHTPEMEHQVVARAHQLSPSSSHKSCTSLCGTSQHSWTRASSPRMDLTHSLTAWVLGKEILPRYVSRLTHYAVVLLPTVITSSAGRTRLSRKRWTTTAILTRTAQLLESTPRHPMITTRARRSRWHQSQLMDVSAI